MTNKIGIYPDRKNKKWVVRWYGKYNNKTDRPKRYSRTFDLRKDAESFKIKKVIEFGNGLQRDNPEKITLGVYCRDWLSVKDANPKTIKLYTQTIERLTNYFGDNVLLRDISPYEAERFISELKSQTGDMLSNWTKWRILRNCKCIFEKALSNEWGYILKNPFKRIKKPTCETRNWYYLEKVEYNQLLDAASSRWKAVIALAYTGGMRFGEAFSRTWGDLDFATGDILIDNKQADELPPFQIKSKGKARKVQLPTKTLNILIKWHAEQPEGIPYILLNKVQYENLLSRWKAYQEQGRQWENPDSVRNINRDLRRIVKRAGIKPVGTFTLHTLRKCAGKNWAMVNNDPKLTQYLMGHKSLKTTLDYYDKVTDKDRARAARSIDEMISPEKSDVKLTF